MGAVLLDEIKSFAGGVVSTLDSATIPPSASPRGWNSALENAGADRASVRKRDGLSLLNATPANSSNPILGQYQFRPRVSGALSRYHLLYTNARLDILEDNGSLTQLTGVTLSGTTFPDFETANNLCFFVNGDSMAKVKTDGTGLQNFGIARPSSAPTVTATGVGVMNGVYEFVIAYYNSVTGHLSSRSGISTITLTNEQARVTIPDATDPQVTIIRVYIRKGTIMTQFFQVASGTGYNTTHGGWADNYGTVDLNLSDDDLNNLIILAPDTAENNPPLSGQRYICWHHSRMFASDGQKLYYSKPGFPESFDPNFVELVNSDDGQMITALESIGGILVIFKTRSIYGLFGDDPNSWYVRRLASDTGCVSHRSVVTVESKTYWWSEQGPIVWTAGSEPFPVGKELIAPSVELSALNPAYFTSICAAVDFEHDRVVFGMPEASQTRNTLILPWNYRLERWEASKWDPMDPSSFAEVVDSTGIPFVALGGYAGQVFRMNSTAFDGVPSGTYAGTFVAGATSISTITDSGATFLTTGGKLIERRVTVVDNTTGQWIGRRRITGNTGTVLTLDSALTVVNGTEYAYYVGTPDFQWDTRWGLFDLPYHKKRFEYLYLDVDANADDTLTLDLAFNLDEEPGITKFVPLDPEDPSWSIELWEASDYGDSEQAAIPRIRVGRTGKSWRLRMRDASAAAITLNGITMQAEQMTTKR